MLYLRRGNSVGNIFVTYGSWNGFSSSDLHCSEIHYVHTAISQINAPNLENSFKTLNGKNTNEQIVNLWMPEKCYKELITMVEVSEKQDQCE